MSALKIIAVCLAAAMVCASIRSQHPQIAGAVALAAGVAAMALSMDDIQTVTGAMKKIYTEDFDYIIRLCGIMLIGEFAADICADIDERALANRIGVGVRLAMLAAAVPTVSEILNKISEILG